MYTALLQHINNTVWWHWQEHLFSTLTAWSTAQHSTARTAEMWRWGCPDKRVGRPPLFMALPGRSIALPPVLGWSVCTCVCVLCAFACICVQGQCGRYAGVLKEHFVWKGKFIMNWQKCSVMSPSPRKNHMIKCQDRWRRDDTTFRY